MKSLKVDDLVKIVKKTSIVKDISNEFVNKFAYVNKIDDKLGIAEINVCDTESVFWIPLYCLEKVKGEEK